MAAATASRMEDQDAWAQSQQINCFAQENGSMISGFFPLLRFLFQHERTGREPDGSFKEQRIHVSSKPNDVGDVLIGCGFFFVRAFPSRHVPNFETTSSADESNFAFQSDLA